MKHVEDIKTFISTLHRSTRFHSLVIFSNPGWGKSTTVEKVLKELSVPFKMLGAYSTNLQFYSTLYQNPSATVVIDDCNLLGQAGSMAILKAATAPSAGTNGERLIVWRSSSEKVPGPEVSFSGKIILLTNNIPRGPDTDALLTRSLFLTLEFDVEDISSMLYEAARNKEYYDNTGLSEKVATYLLDNFSKQEKEKLNLRTLQIAYELAKLNPENWPDLLERLMPPSEPAQLVKKLNRSETPVESQARRFMKITGLSRRTFFSYRQELGISKKSPPSEEKVQSSGNCALLASSGELVVPPCQVEKISLMEV